MEDVESDIQVENVKILHPNCERKKNEPIKVLHINLILGVGFSSSVHWVVADSD